MKTFFVAVLLLLSLPLQSSGQGDSHRVKNDLRGSWLVYSQDKFVLFDSADVAPGAIYFTLKANDFKNSFLRISSSNDLSIFINNNLAATGSSFTLSIDSLVRSYAASILTVAVHQKGGLHDEALQTTIVERASPGFEDSLVRRAESGFRDFAIAILLLLMIMAIVIVRLNPRLASDYFSLPKMFSSREVEDAQIYSRIGSSTNILFYLYSSMLLAYYLIVIFHFVSDRYSLAADFSHESFGLITLDWLKLTMYLLLILFTKIIIVFALSYMFGLPEIAGIHFFNWVRLLLVVFGILVLIIFMYVIWHGQSITFHSVMLQLVGWFIAAWMFLIFFKLAGKVGASMFHLFSYICATELIPFLFIIKELYN
jgi:hypothetical protein